MRSDSASDMRRIHPTAVLDVPFRHYQGCKAPEDIDYRATSFGDRLEIGAFTVIGRGVALAEGVVIDHPDL